MKKIILVLGISLFVFSCQKTDGNKTAYIDTLELLKNYDEAKDLDAKYKAKAELMGGDLKKEIEIFQAQAASFEKDAKANGQAWAQKRGNELQKKEQQLTYAQQAIQQQLQEESGKEMDSLKSNLKKFIKEYGKKNAYSYIYGTGEVATVLYAEDKLDITKEITKLLNEKYKLAPKKVTPVAPIGDSVTAVKDSVASPVAK
jgi:outer membrane protein